MDEMIFYLENHLTEPINYRKLSLIVGLPPYILQRVFCFITGMSIAEYVRKRKLSKAYEDLLTRNFTISDLSYKYGYSSNSSFSRAFKRYFHLLPKEAIKQNKRLAYSKLVFSENIIKSELFSYAIEKMDSLVLYGKKVSISDDYYPQQIHEFYSYLCKSGLLDVFKKNIWYGLTLIENGKCYYFVGSKKNIPNLEKIEVPLSKYLFLDDIIGKQNEIVKKEIELHCSYLPSTSYSDLESKIYELEIYNKDKCMIGIPVL